MDLILKYFPDLTEEQKRQFAALYDLYMDWNSKINVISRKDIENLYELLRNKYRVVLPSRLYPRVTDCCIIRLKSFRR